MHKIEGAGFRACPFLLYVAGIVAFAPLVAADRCNACAGNFPYRTTSTEQLAWWTMWEALLPIR